MSKKNKQNKRKMSTNNSTTPSTGRLPVINVAIKPKVILTKEFLSEVNYLHNKYPTVEWSGFIVFKEEGSIGNPSELVLRVLGIHPLDVGSATFTSSEIEKMPDAIIDMWERFPDIGTNGIKMGYCHTHHSMEAFFSGTDEDELYTNYKNFPYYLSLIVNFKCKPVAKIAIGGVRKKTVTEDCVYFKESPEITEQKKIDFVTDSNESPVILTFDCNIEFETNNVFISNLTKLEESLAELKKKNTYAYGNQSGMGFHGYGGPDAAYGSYHQRNSYANNTNSTTNKKVPNLKHAPFIQLLMLRHLTEDIKCNNYKSYNYNSSPITFLGEIERKFKALSISEREKYIENLSSFDVEGLDCPFIELLDNHIYDYFDSPELKKYAVNKSDIINILDELKNWATIYSNSYSILDVYISRVLPKLLFNVKTHLNIQAFAN